MIIHDPQCMMLPRPFSSLPLTRGYEGGYSDFKLKFYRFLSSYYFQAYGIVSCSIWIQTRCFPRKIISIRFSHHFSRSPVRGMVSSAPTPSYTLFLKVHPLYFFLSKITQSLLMIFSPEIMAIFPFLFFQ